LETKRLHTTLGLKLPKKKFNNNNEEVLTNSYYGYNTQVLTKK
jgi:hypothetical protein